MERKKEEFLVWGFFWGIFITKAELKACRAQQTSNLKSKNQTKHAQEDGKICTIEAEESLNEDNCCTMQLLQRISRVPSTASFVWVA